MNRLFAIAAVFALGACSEKPSEEQKNAPEQAPPTQAAVATPQASPTPEAVKVTKLEDVLASQSEESKARFAYRHPKETLEFLGIQPGQTVAEALPGGGWYSKILLPFIGPEGKLIGLDYPYEIWPNFTGFVTDEFLEKRKTWPQTWPEEAKAWELGEIAQIEAYTLSTIPEALNESVDSVLYIRALHNIHRFSNEKDFMGETLKDTYRILKPGGTVGVIQHQAPEDKSDEWADGSRGYLKKSTLVKLFTDAGFTLVKESDINSNPKDIPGENDIVWRLPPSYATSSDNPELKAKFAEIGESNRMTLLFKK